jgi:hypothetical protein
MGVNRPDRPVVIIVNPVGGVLAVPKQTAIKRFEV